MRYVKCVNPKKTRNWTSGDPMKFTDVGNNIGIGKIEDADKIRQIEAMIADNRGGIFFIEEAEFESLKKNQTSSPASTPWREEISRRGVEVNRRVSGLPPSIAPEAGVAGTNLTVGPNPQTQTGGTGINVEVPRPKASKRT